MILLEDGYIPGSRRSSATCPHTIDVNTEELLNGSSPAAAHVGSSGDPQLPDRRAMDNVPSLISASMEVADNPTGAPRGCSSPRWRCETRGDICSEASAESEKIYGHARPVPARTFPFRNEEHPSSRSSKSSILHFGGLIYTELTPASACSTRPTRVWKRRFRRREDRELGDDANVARHAAQPGFQCRIADWYGRRPP